jgi:YesN/AraC family two-component response regulator
MEPSGKLDVAVLYVEDEPATRQALSPPLERRVRELFTAANGEEGLALFRERRPDIVITDITMPVMNGLAMIRGVRSLAAGTPVIVTTAYGDTRYLIESIEVGVDRYIMKPVDNEKLFATLQQCALVVTAEREAQRHHAERERLIGELQQALLKVKQLSGLLPICMHCKKIRDDAGAWQQMEAYICTHAEVDFSHGICPDCLREQYPEQWERMRKLGESGA